DMENATEGQRCMNDGLGHPAVALGIIRVRDQERQDQLDVEQGSKPNESNEDELRPPMVAVAPRHVGSPSGRRRLYGNNRQTRDCGEDASAAEVRSNASKLVRPTTDCDGVEPPNHRSARSHIAQNKRTDTAIPAPSLPAVSAVVGSATIPPKSTASIPSPLNVLATFRQTYKLTTSCRFEVGSSIHAFRQPAGPRSMPALDDALRVLKLARSNMPTAALAPVLA